MFVTKPNTCKARHCQSVCVCACAVGVGPSGAVIPALVASLIRSFGIHITHNPQSVHTVQLKQCARVPTHSALVFLLLRGVCVLLFSAMLLFHSPACWLSHRDQQNMCVPGENKWINHDQFCSSILQSVVLLIFFSWKCVKFSFLRNVSTN